MPRCRSPATSVMQQLMPLHHLPSHSCAFGLMAAWGKYHIFAEPKHVYSGDDKWLILDPTTRRFPLRLLYFIWDAEHDLAIRKIFDYKMGRRLQQMLNDVRNGQDQQTCWLGPEENDAGFRHQHLTNQANRASEILSKYTSSSATFMKMKVRLSKSLDREATLVETFKYTHKNKTRFVDQWSHDHYRLASVIQQSQQSGKDVTDGAMASIVDPDAVWREIASALYKNLVYGMGPFLASSLRTSMLRPLSGSTTSPAVQSEEGVDLRLQVQELHCSLHQQAQELNNYRKRYQKILTCVTSTNELRLKFRESLERMQRMEAQMKVYQAQMHAAGIDPADGSGPVAGDSGSIGGTRTSSSPPAPPTQGHGIDDNDNDDYLNL
ncbi:hypothetical protein Ahy_B03g067076 [Arachis hypogaea]|uniref:Uncharacterized protein n=1 Tax=Arachis hypogaea TaxID=3818 RepID=A0A445A5K9_ARAHY|nr:hypothetical protein Ahy_B03g067076 [Arachis hypogaea]